MSGVPITIKRSSGEVTDQCVVGEGSSTDLIDININHPSPQKIPTVPVENSAPWSEAEETEYKAEYIDLKKEVEIGRLELSKQKELSTNLKQECETLISTIQMTQTSEQQKIQRMKILQEEKAQFSKAVEEKIIERDQTKQSADRAIALRNHIKMKLLNLNGLENTGIDVKTIIAEIETVNNDSNSRSDRIKRIQELLPPGIVLPDDLKNASASRSRRSNATRRVRPTSRYTDHHC